MKTRSEEKKSEPSDSKERYTLSFNEKTGNVSISKKQERAKRTKFTDAWFYLGFVGEIGYAIALPVVGGALLGRYLDFKWSSYPKATLSLLFTGIVISIVGFIRTIQELIQRKN